MKNIIKNLNIKEKLNLKIIVIVTLIMIIGLTTLGYFTNSVVKDEITFLAKQRNKNITKNVQSQINSFLGESKKIVNYTADETIFKNLNKPEIKKTLTNIGKKYSQFNLYWD